MKYCYKFNIELLLNVMKISSVTIVSKGMSCRAYKNKSLFCIDKERERQQQKEGGREGREGEKKTDRQTDRQTEHQSVSHQRD